jgi:heme-degrading monooxygenase HmoA
MYVLVYEYEIDPGRREAFEREYGSTGGWARLFGQAEGYLGSALHREVDQRSCHYVLLDRWDSSAAFEEFMRRYGEDYRARNPTTRDLYLAERRLGALIVPSG